jgi:predicted site-specific integrase-resolvase
VVAREKTVRRTTKETAQPKLPIYVREPHVYVRVSTWKQKMEGFSLPDQITRCRHEAAAMGQGAIADENVLFDADSGKNYQRESLQELLTRAKQGGSASSSSPRWTG